MTYTKLAYGEYTWAITTLSRGDKSDYNKPRRSDADHNSDDNLDANLAFEYEKVINFGNFYYYFYLDVVSLLKRMPSRLSKFALRQDNVLNKSSLIY